MSYVVANLEDSFSRDEAHYIISMQKKKLIKVIVTLFTSTIKENCVIYNHYPEIGWSPFTSCSLNSVGMFWLRVFRLKCLQTLFIDRYFRFPTRSGWRIKLSSHEQCFFGNEYLSQKLLQSVCVHTEQRNLLNKMCQ